MMSMRAWRRAGCAILLLVVAGAILFTRLTGVHEIHHARQGGGSIVADAKPGPDDWPWWRGADQRNVVASAAIPVQWSERLHVAWHAPLPGRGHSSPCVWRNRVFLTTADAERETITLLCFDRASGHLVWDATLLHGKLMEKHAKNSHASATPACDGERVYVPATMGGSLWVTAVDFEGHIVWQREAGPYAASNGYGSSPVINKSLVIVAGDNDGKRIDRIVGTSHLAAFDRQTGEIVWRVKRPQGDSFGTPIVARICDKDQLVMAGKGAVIAYDPATGTEIWRCRWTADRTANTVAFDDRRVVASSREPSPVCICVRADGSGDVTSTHLAWSAPKCACDVPSPVLADGLVYSLVDSGVLNCLDAATGEVKWKRRLNGRFFSSPVIAGPHLYCSNENGTTFVIALGKSGAIEAQNSIGEGLYASAVFIGDQLLLRTASGLFCVAGPERTDKPSEGPLAAEPQAAKRRL